MPGLCFSNNAYAVDVAESCDGCITQTAVVDGYAFSLNTLNRFMEDKAFGELGEYFVISEGVILNKASLLERESCSSVIELIVRLYERDGDSFCREFRGPFSGLLYDKRLRKVVAYTNHYGDKAIFYSRAGHHVVIASSPKDILTILQSKGVPVSIDEEASYQMLSYGFLTGERTYVKEIKRLLPGNVLVFHDERVFTENYFRPKSLPILDAATSDGEIIETMDELFRNAVRLEFEKDREYGYRHLCDLSGGFDSRMTTWVARDLGYSDIVNVTYCQQGNLDERIASQIACYLRNELIFKPLDDASFLFEAERIVGMNCGAGLYSGITGGESLLRNIDFRNFGLEHTGQIGDVVVGSFIEKAEDLCKIEHSGAYSNTLLDRLKPVEVEEYVDREQYLLCTRAFMGALSTHFIRQYYTEVASPFLDVDFMEYCLSISAEKRARHALYKRWMQSKYPEAADFIWEKEGYAISDGPIRKAIRSFRRYAGRGARLLLPGSRLSSSGSMNPFEYWESTRPDIVEYLHDVIGRKDRLPISDQLVNDIELIDDNGKCIELTQAATAVLAMEYYVHYGVFAG